MRDPTSKRAPRQDTVTEPPSLRIIESVAEAEGVSPLELEPISTVVDPEALDSLFRPQLKVHSVADSSAEVRFDYHGYSVRVTATGLVSIDGNRTNSGVASGATAD